MNENPARHQTPRPTGQNGTEGFQVVPPFLSHLRSYLFLCHKDKTSRKGNGPQQ